MGHFAAIDLLSVLGSPQCWAIRPTLAEVIGKAGACRERAGVKEAQVKHTTLLGAAVGGGYGSGTANVVPMFPVCADPTGYRSSIPAILEWLSIKLGQRSVGHLRLVPL